MYTDPSNPTAFLHCVSLYFQLEDRRLGLDQLWDMDAKEIGAAVRHPAAGTSMGLQVVWGSRY